ncbi:HupE/UreJ family protein [Paenibacillus sp. NPDC056722]|uniref:HupE/UreJ family protein n=1 Tax=Paenibacillus sp. NPDC056722 TaxID=3345924 RepID=UPI0036CB7EDD
MKRFFKGITIGCLLFLLSLCIVPPFSVSAHPLSVSYSTVTNTGNGVEFVYSIDLLSVTESTNVGLIDKKKLQESHETIDKWIRKMLSVKIDNVAQAGQLKSMELEDKRELGLTLVRVVYNFPNAKNGQTISLDDAMYMGNSSNYTNLLVFKEGDSVTETVLKGGERHWQAVLGEVQEGSHHSTLPGGWIDFLLLGAEHILTGYDHLLFLLALLLRKQTLKQYASIITAFTIAHSITLTLAVTGIVSVPSRFVEATIALSICYVAIENLFLKKISHRTIITFLFGLIHGLGFAGILSEMDIPKSHLAVSLVSFNAGIEVIQLTLVALLLPLLTWSQRTRYQRQGVIIASTIIALIGAFWSIERLFL